MKQKHWWALGGLLVGTLFGSKITGGLHRFGL